jgi:DNA helicase II / ATP-dependent DNA helicase PcrA
MSEQRSLNVAQQKAVEHSDGHLLIVAGAGTGKTTVITEKIAYLIKNGLAKPEEILALTFTDAAAFEMQERVDKLLDTGYAEMHISTFHAFAQELLEEFGLDIGVPNRFKLYTEIDSWLMLRNHVYDLGLSYYRPIGNPSRHLDGLIRHFLKCKDELISTEEYLTYAQNLEIDTDNEAESKDEQTRLTELAHVYHSYNQLLLQNNALDFGDLMYYAVKLLTERPRVTSIMQKRFKYVLVDEFQDVNWAQYILVRHIVGQSGKLCVVGDDDQSIYAFRGASVSNIMRFKEDYPDATDIVLNENYRSAQEILDASYGLVQNNNPDRLEVKLGIDKKLIANSAQPTANSFGQIVKHVEYATGEDEVRGVVERMMEIKTKERCEWDAFAILVRANNHAEAFMEALSKRGIPFFYNASTGLFRQSIVLDTIAYLQLLDNHRESNAVYRLLRLPMFGLSEHDITTFTAFAKQKAVSYYEALQQVRLSGMSEAATEVCEKILSLIHAGMSETKSESPTAVLYHFFENSGYFAYLTEEDAKGNAMAVRAVSHLRAFLDRMNEYEISHPQCDVRQFLDYFNFVIESGDEGALPKEEAPQGAVRIMTVHGSKGLEFDHVFVVNMVADRFPSRRRGDAIPLPDGLIKEVLPSGDAHIQEERRLCYVACTRARHTLTLTSAKTYGGVREKKVSQFVAELGCDSLKTGLEIPEESTLLDSVRRVNLVRAEDAVHYELPKTFSFSQLHLFEDDPYQYKIERILKIPQKGSPHFSFGQSMHLTLQRFYETLSERNSVSQSSLFDTPAPIKTEGLSVPTQEEMLSLFEQSWIPDWYKSREQREEYYQKGKEIVSEFYKKHDGSWRIPVFLESGFKIKLGEYTVTGKIDRIDKREDGMLEIMDYKTGSPKKKLEAHDKEQLLLYQMAVSSLRSYQAYGDVGALTYYYLNDQSSQSFLGADKDIDKLREKMIRLIDEIYATDWSQVFGPDGRP